MARHGAAPTAECVLTYRGGLTRSRIAALTGAPASTVGYHLALALAADPGLQADHEQAARKTPPRVTGQGLARMRELVAIVQQTGRYPSRTSTNPTERTLESWLERRRHDAVADTLAVDEARWHDRLTALKAYSLRAMTGPCTSPS